MPVIRVDGNEYQVPAGKNLLEACLSAGLDLPYFCWHPAMGSIGACRQCAVVQYQDENDQNGRLVMGCMTPATDGAIFSLEADKAKQFRETIVESLMLNHPHDCPVCAEGGECHLQDMTVMVGHRDRHYRGRKNTHRNQYLGPLIHHEMNRCITCYRCTRFYRDHAGGTDLSAQAAHDHVYFGRHEDGILESEFAGNLVEVCPTGVFTDKTLVHEYTRKWDLQSAPSVCTGCAVGCNTLPGERYGKLKRVHNRFNVAVNGYFLCDRGRFGAAYVNRDDRLRFPGLRNKEGRYDAIDHHRALQEIHRACDGAEVFGIGSPRASIEANFLLREWVGAENFAPGFSDAEQPLLSQVLQLNRSTNAAIPDLQTIESADAILILGEDVTNTAPRLALAVRQSVRNKAHSLAADLRLESWQDAAVRNLSQDQLSPLYIASVAATRLDDVAEDQFSLAPANIARLGFAIAAQLDAPDIETGDSDEPVVRIAQALSRAERPLIVSGTGCASSDVLAAAGQIAQSLCASGTRAMLSLVVPEANSLGQVMLAGELACSLTTLQEASSRCDAPTLVVLENDLFRRGPRAQVESLLANFKQVVVLDGLDNATTSIADLALPAASATETEGTLVSMEGRAQRYFPVLQPAADRHPSWVWLLAYLKEMNHPCAQGLRHFDDITEACAGTIACLADITAAAPDHTFRNKGLKVPRQPHRYSGRTAMRANVSVHEPKQAQDEESALAYSMEGLNRAQPGALLPFVWSPGWNSNQSLHKFQSEAGGSLRGGTAGVRLLTTGQGNTLGKARPPEAFKPRDGQWQLVPRQKIFGSDELSALSPAIAELTAPAYIELCSADAQSLGALQGDGITVADGLVVLELHIDDTIACGCAGFSEGHSGTEDLVPLEYISLHKAQNWQRRSAQLIGSDRSQDV